MSWWDGPRKPFAVGAARYERAMLADPAPHPSKLISAERYLHRRLRSRLAVALDGHGFSYSQFEVMAMLDARTNMHAGQIARMLRLSPQSVHGLVHKLAAAGLVAFVGTEGWGRPIALTDLGRRRVRTAWTVLEETVHAALLRVPRDERRMALEAMERCEQALAPLRPPWWLG